MKFLILSSVLLFSFTSQSFADGFPLNKETDPKLEKRTLEFAASARTDTQERNLQLLLEFRSQLDGGPGSDLPYSRIVPIDITLGFAPGSKDWFLPYAKIKAGLGQFLKGSYGEDYRTETRSAYELFRGEYKKDITLQLRDEISFYAGDVEKEFRVYLGTKNGESTENLTKLDQLDHLMIRAAITGVGLRFLQLTRDPNNDNYREGMSLVRPGLGIGYKISFDKNRNLVLSLNGEGDLGLTSPGDGDRAELRDKGFLTVAANAELRADWQHSKHFKAFLGVGCRMLNLYSRSANARPGDNTSASTYYGEAGMIVDKWEWEY